MRSALNRQLLSAALALTLALASFLLAPSLQAQEVRADIFASGLKNL